MLIFAILNANTSLINQLENMTFGYTFNMRSQILCVVLVLLALESHDSSATFISMARTLTGQNKYSANQEAAKPSIGQIIGGKIDGIQNIKSMLLSPFLGLAAGLLSKPAPPAAAPAPAPAPAAAPAPAPADGGGGGGDYGGVTYAADAGYNQGSGYSSGYTNGATSYGNGGGSYSGPSNSDHYNNGLYGDTGKSDDFYAQDGLSLGTSKYDNFGRLTSTGGYGFDGSTKRDGLDIVVTGPYDHFGSSSGYYSGDHYGWNDGPYGYGGGHGGGYSGGHGGGYSGGRGGQGKGHAADQSAKGTAAPAKPQASTKGIGIGIGFQKNFQITWPSFGSKKSKSY